MPWPARRVTTAAEVPHGAAGPRGTYVMYAVDPLSQAFGKAPQVVRRLRGTRWARPRSVLSEVNANTSDADLVQDERGRLHAAIVGTDRSGRRTCIAYARSRRERWFTRAVSLHRSRGAGRPEHVRLGVDARGRGAVAWTTTTTPPAVRLQRLKAGSGVTRPVRQALRACPPYPG